MAASADLTSSIVWYTGPDGAVLRANPPWERFTGQPFEQYAGWGWLDAIHPEDRTRVVQEWRAGVERCEPFQMDYRLRRADGVFRDVSDHEAPFSEAGVAREWVGVCIDITDSRRAQQALRDSEVRLRLLDRLSQETGRLTDATQIMAVTAQVLGETLGATRCAYADADLDGDRFTIRSDWSLPGVPSSVGVYALDRFGDRASSTLRQGRHVVVRDVSRELGDEGGARMFDTIGTQAILCAGLVKEGRLVAMMAVHQSSPRDWTAQEVALVEEVVERCWAHIERVRDNARLREQDRRRDEFLATLAHELRNPLAPIKYAVAMMRLRKEPAVRAQAQDVVDRQVSLMARLIDDLLDLSRINRGLIQLQREPVALHLLMERALESARPAITSAHHLIEVSLPPAEVVVDVDAARIVQVIGSLLDNAAKYTPDGGRIRLAGRVVSGQAVLEVADNGIGIPPQEQGKLFQRFGRLAHSATRAPGGLGIGLLVVKHLVELHGGQVRVASRGLDQGATFTVQLPLAASVPEMAPVERAADPPGARQRILVVEDNQDGRETLLSLLAMLGHEVAGAADGGQAMVEARRFEPQVVLLDLGLPVKDGLEVAREMRADARLRGTYIVALTGADTDPARMQAAGFDAHLIKPVDVAVLEQVLAKAARAGRASSAGA